MDLAFFLLLFLLLLLPLLFLLNHSKPQPGCAPPPPGPRGWLVLGNLLQLGAIPHRTLDAHSKKYGPLFRLRLGSVEVVVAASAEVASEFLRTHDAIFSDCPPNSGAEHMAYNYQDVVFGPYGPHWRALRKLFSLHLFSTKALDGLFIVASAEVGGRSSGEAWKQARIGREELVAWMLNRRTRNDCLPHPQNGRPSIPNEA